MSESLPEAYFVDGGTLLASTPSYVKRPADDELFDALIKREYCYVLTPRQMGKSSLMIRTAQRLKEINIKTATVDIQGIGTDKIREWYASLLSQIRRGLKLSVDIDEWMKKKGHIGFGQLFMDFIQDVVLIEIPEQIVIFLDEVDWMIKIDFRDDFFASIRSMYNARAQYSEFNRVSFVLLGVASPADLISEPTRTPFNIGHAIPLQELSLKDAAPLQAGLEQVRPGESNHILDRIFYWTSGHPYLTQKLCKTIVETEKENWSSAEVDDLVYRLFLAEESRKEANLKFIEDRILSNEQFAQMLRLYKRVRQTKIKESGQSIIQNQLMLSGLLTSRDGYLEVRNRIYRAVFNDRWITKNTPRSWQRIALVVLSSLVAILLTVIGYNYTVDVRLKTYQADYINADSNAQKITALAHIYRLRYLFSSNTNVDLEAAETFYDFTPSGSAQLSLFPPYGFSDPAKQNDLVSVIKKLYVTLADVDEENDNTSLLQAMDDALNSGTNSNLKQEIDNWLIGRKNYRKSVYDAALSGYEEAVRLNSGNQATLYERAKVYIALGQFEKAAKDLDDAIGAAKQFAPNIPPSPIPTSSPLPPGEMTSSSTTESANITPRISTTITSEANGISTLAIMPTLDTSPSSLPTPIKSNKFLSNFTTQDHVEVAIRALIAQTPELQTVIQSTGDVNYANLEAADLVQNYPSPTPSSVAACDRAQFIADVTVPDGTRFAPGATFTKTWRLKNIGTCTWTTSYTLEYDSGAQMGNSTSVNFPSDVTPGQSIDLYVNMTAPSKPGHYISYWKLRNASGIPFGIGLNANNSWWVDINVNGASTSSVAYDFAANAGAATWSSGAGELRFPGRDGDDKGFVLTVSNPNYESGVVGSSPGLLTFPQNTENGYIQGIYPSFDVHNDDRFQSTIGCEAGATNCYVAFRLDYQTGTDPIKTFWGPSLQRYEGLTYNVDIDLSPLAGKDVKFILTVLATGTPIGDRALWGDPVIVRAEASSSLLTPGGPTGTPFPDVAYDFTANVCAGSWFSRAGQLPCPGTDGDAKGFVLKVSNPKLENGDTDARPGLITFPQNIQDGYIQGFFPPLRVQNGDRFRSIIGCESGATDCYVSFSLDYQTGADPIKTYGRMFPFIERYEGKYYSVDVDLSLLAGKDVKFILTVRAAGTAKGDRALWVSPIIYRAGTGSSPPTPTPK